MTQPLYETLRDRVRQRAVAEAFATARGYWYRLTSEESLAPWDASFYDADAAPPVILAEIKCRDVERFHYTTFKIDQSKIDGLLAEAARVSATAIVLVQFTDGIVYRPVDRRFLTVHAKRSTLLRADRDGEGEDPVYEWRNVMWYDLTEDV